MITFIESFIHELKHERIGTEKILALCPADKADYKPHRKSMSLKDLATHLADIPAWISYALTTDELDFGTNPYNPRPCSTGEEYVAFFNENVEQAIRDLEAAKEEILLENWTLRNGDEIYMTLTRLETIRHSFGQMIHHRAQLGVYLRLNDIPIPGVYGPSADDMGL
ncbi:MAG: DinB family protein [Saprospiraceae bacterium]|nr:DinB family protein [Saprospiraceae bacterium]MBK8851825.1 DinB family protein [Saprospiraceae bacterium]